MAASTDQSRTGARDRYRNHVKDEVKHAALRQLADGGPQALSVNAIAKELGMSGPALYRYFTGRDDLLTELVLDAYADLAETLTVAGARGAGLAPPDRLRAVAHAYRRWALDQPHRYVLLYRPPLPGYDAHAEQLVEAAGRSMAVLLELLVDLDVEDAELPADLAEQLQGWTARLGDRVGPPMAVRAIELWTRLHGFVDIEIGGSFASMGLDPGRLFEREVTRMLA